MLNMKKKVKSYIMYQYYITPKTEQKNKNMFN